MSVSVLIPFTSEIPTFVDGLRTNAGIPIELILVNDGGSPDCAQQAKALSAVYIHNLEPLGTCVSLTKAAGVAKGSTLIYLPTTLESIQDNWALDLHLECTRLPRALQGIGAYKNGAFKINPHRYLSDTLDLQVCIGDNLSNSVALSSDGFAIPSIYFRRLGGLRLLTSGASIGMNLPLKVLLEGGRVIASDLGGLVCKKSNDTIPLVDKLITLLTLVPEIYLERYLTALKSLDGFEEAMTQIDALGPMILKFRDTITPSFKVSFGTWEITNNKLQDIYA